MPCKKSFWYKRFSLKMSFSVCFWWCATHVFIKQIFRAVEVAPPLPLPPKGWAGVGVIVALFSHFGYGYEAVRIRVNSSELEASSGAHQKFHHRIKIILFNLLILFYHFHYLLILFCHFRNASYFTIPYLDLPTLMLFRIFSALKGHCHEKRSRTWA
jgi:hypothetical protein